LIGEISAWAGLAAAVLSIGLEIWKARHPRPRTTAHDDDDLDAYFPPFFRGVTVSGALPIAALILAANALGLASDDFYHQAAILDPNLLVTATGSSASPSPTPVALVNVDPLDALEASRLVAVCSFIRLAVALMAFSLVVLIVRFVGSYVYRAWTWLNDYTDL
jgi:hypothetical protein